MYPSATTLVFIYFFDHCVNASARQVRSLGRMGGFAFVLLNVPVIINTGRYGSYRPYYGDHILRTKDDIFTRPVIGPLSAGFVEVLERRGLPWFLHGMEELGRCLLMFMRIFEIDWNETFLDKLVWDGTGPWLPYDFRSGEVGS